MANQEKTDNKIPFIYSLLFGLAWFTVFDIFRWILGSGLDLKSVGIMIVSFLLTEPLTYYIMNQRSFKPVTGTLFAGVLIVNFIPQLLVALLLIFVLM